MTLGEHITNSGYSITDMSKITKISRQTIYSIINNKYEPTIPTIKQICKLLNLDYMEYLPEKFNCIKGKLWGKQTKSIIKL